MCHLVYYPPGVMPVREHLENGARLNPHGCGFALGYVAMRGLDSQKMISQFLAHRERFPELPALFHSRNATGDSPVTAENIHPFEVPLGGFLAHNGYLFPHEGNKADSLIFAEDILPRYDLDDAAQLRLLERRMGPNKAVILRQGKPPLILNRQLGLILEDGSWHSNADCWGIPHMTDGECPVCHAETDRKPVCASCETKAQERRALLMEDTHAAV